ncbi:MAG: caspase family protein, partial [Deltaproteobacteria bacterium]|nr:caspase family protein [Deltaproteobacteria bacterium]
MKGSAKLIAFIGMVALSFIYVAGLSHGQDCGVAKDWKDIYILPTNPNPQSNIKVNLTADKKVAKPGDDLNLTFSADRECYLTLMDMGTSGRIIRLWPNDYSGQDNRIQPNVTRNFPGPGDNFRFKIGGPNGVERLIAYATSEKGRILSEQEFQQLQSTGFQQYIGGAKDLAFQFQKAAEAMATNISWGTAQANVCIGSGPQASTEPPTPSKTFMMAVGADTGGLKFCARDAQRITDTLKGKMGIQESNVKLLLGADANYHGFSSAIQWLASTTQPEDTVVIYYSGHGGSVPDRPPLDEEDGRDEFIVLYPGAQKEMTTDAMLNKKIFLIDDEINVLIKKIPARRKIMIADCCHSGTINKELGLDVGDLVSKYQPTVDPVTGADDWSLGKKAIPPNYGNDHEGLLAACLDSESSYESKSMQSGVFTHYLIEAINQGSPDLEQAFNKAKGNVALWVKERSKPGKQVSQTPSLTDPHGLSK